MSRAHRDDEPPTPASAARTAVAILLGWLVPGLGHVSLGRVRNGLLFGAIIWTSFGLGLANDGRLALRDTRQPLLTTLQVVANLGVGPADVVARLAVYGEPAYSMTSGPGQREDPELAATFRDRIRSGGASYGTAYLWTAGLMNLLLLFDVWDVARGRRAGW